MHDPSPVKELAQLDEDVENLRKQIERTRQTLVRWGERLP